MEQQQLDKLKLWFDEYVNGFYGDDQFINANIKLKHNHSKRTCTDMLYLAEHLKLDQNQRIIAETIALLHDIGRFEQFVKYRTYNDPASINHSLLGIEILKQKNILAQLDQAEQQIINQAIEYHGAKALPGDLKGPALLFSQLIRDADKLDIFYIAVHYYKQHAENPDSFKMEIELPDSPEYSQQVIEDICEGKRVDYSKLRTWNDMKLCQLAWVYDVNFTPTLKRIKQKRYLETVLDFLPKTDDITMVEQKIFDYVNSTIEKNKLEIES